MRQIADYRFVECGFNSHSALGQFYNFWRPHYGGEGGKQPASANLRILWRRSGATSLELPLGPRRRQSAFGVRRREKFFFSHQVSCHIAS